MLKVFFICGLHSFYSFISRLDYTWPKYFTELKDSISRTLCLYCIYSNCTCTVYVHTVFRLNSQLLDFLKRSLLLILLMAIL
uniref:Secreted protein n=1 Tax=Pyxicephalus adspersus TaxID=30357 RepID=A0AAV3AMX3_PYXAD|nr:TPA: hypothetical protein GDO54_011813 [Pyxicephalus adspersus]